MRSYARGLAPIRSQGHHLLDSACDTDSDAAHQSAACIRLACKSPRRRFSGLAERGSQWRPIRTSQLSAPDLLPQSPDVKVGPFEWFPAAGTNSMLMAVSALGDLSNLRKFGVGKPISMSRLVPNDNNLG